MKSMKYEIGNRKYGKDMERLFAAAHIPYSIFHIAVTGGDS